MWMYGAVKAASVTTRAQGSLPFKLHPIYKCNHTKAFSFRFCFVCAEIVLGSR